MDTTIGSRVWVLISPTDRGTWDVEIFSERPHTYNDPSNWPPKFRLYEGNADGGDSVLIEERGIW